MHRGSIGLRHTLRSRFDDVIHVSQGLRRAVPQAARQEGCHHCCSEQDRLGAQASRVIQR